MTVVILFTSAFVYSLGCNFYRSWNSQAVNPSESLATKRASVVSLFVDLLFALCAQGCMSARDYDLSDRFLKTDFASLALIWEQVEWAISQ